MYERKTQPLAHKKIFYKRLFNSFSLALLLIVFSLLIGITGYYFIAGLSWVDSLLNASMILTGMGPVDPMPDNASKIFASLYAIYSGVAFLSSIAIFLAPAVHRILHKLHVDDKE